MKSKNAIAIIVIALIVVIASIFANCIKNPSSDKVPNSSKTEYGQTEIADTPFEKASEADQGEKTVFEKSQKNTSAKAQNSAVGNSETANKSSAKTTVSKTTAEHKKEKTGKPVSTSSGSRKTTVTTTAPHTDLPFVPVE